jgi:DhnA family fructose-bisphosphate aldolase class Ia
MKFKVEYSLFGGKTEILWTTASSIAKARYNACNKIASQRGLTSYAVRQYFENVPLAIKIEQEKEIKKCMNL